MSPENTTPRVATIARHNGQAVGVCIFLTADQLRELDIEPTETDAVAYDLLRINESSAVWIAEATDSELSNVANSIAD